MRLHFCRSRSRPSLSPARTADNRAIAQNRGDRGRDNDSDHTEGAGGGESSRRRKKQKKEERKAKKREQRRAKREHSSNSDRSDRHRKKKKRKTKTKSEAARQQSEDYDSGSSGSSSSKRSLPDKSEEGRLAKSAEARVVATTERTAEAPSSAVVDEDAPTPPGNPEPRKDIQIDGLPSAATAGPAKGGTDDKEPCVDEDAPTPPASPSRTHPAAEVPVSTAVGKNSFFAQLHAMERKKGTVGTMHATGGSGGGGSGGGGPIQSSDWECLKCGKSNYKNASACDRYTTKNPKLLLPVPCCALGSHV